MSSLLTTLKTYLYPPSPTTPSHYSPSSPCRFHLDNSTSATLRLPDGRTLGYAQYGSPTGFPILYNHGFPGSRIEAAAHHDTCAQLGLRIISIDRPGHGWSSPHPGATLLDWPKDVACLAEHLCLERYAVMGVSGGGPATLACAFSLPSARLSCISLVCAVGPRDIGWRGADIAHRLGWPHGIPRMPYWFGRMFWRAQAIGRLDVPEARRVEMLVKENATAEDKDADIFGDVDFARLVVRAAGEAFAQGYDYVWDDGGMSCGEFGFGVEEVRRDLKAQLWYGRKDYCVPANHGVQIAARLGPNACLRIEDESHAGILVHWKTEIFEAIKESM